MEVTEKPLVEVTYIASSGHIIKYICKELKFIYSYISYKPYSFCKKNLNSFCYVQKAFPDYFGINGYKFLFSLESPLYSLNVSC